MQINKHGQHVITQDQNYKDLKNNQSIQPCNHVIQKNMQFQFNLKTKNVSTRYTYFSHFLKIRLCKMNFLVRLFQKPFTKQIKQMLIIIQFMSFLFFFKHALLKPHFLFNYAESFCQKLICMHKGTQSNVYRKPHNE